LDFTGTGSYEAAKRYMFGLKGDIPIVGDWDDSGRNRIGVFRKGLWILDMDGDDAYSAIADKSFSFGGTGDLPIVGDWDNSGRIRIGVFRNGNWMLDLTCPQELIQR
jgi:hypothetical protein